MRHVRIRRKLPPFWQIMLVMLAAMVGCVYYRQPESTSLRTYLLVDHASIVDFLYGWSWRCLDRKE
jgi:hypothetical protein